MMDFLITSATMPDSIKLLVLIGSVVMTLLLGALIEHRVKGNRVRELERNLSEAKDLIEEYIMISPYRALSNYLPTKEKITKIVEESIPIAYREDDKLIKVLLTDSLKAALVNSVSISISNHFERISAEMYEREQGYMDEESLPDTKEKVTEDESFEDWVKRNWDLDLNTGTGYQDVTT